MAYENICTIYRRHGSGGGRHLCLGRRHPGGNLHARTQKVGAVEPLWEQCELSLSGGFPAKLFLPTSDAGGQNRSASGESATNGSIQKDRQERAKVRVRVSLPRRRQVRLAGVRLRAGAVPPKSEAKDAKKDAEKKADDKAAKERSDKPESAVAALANQVAKALARATAASSKNHPYNRLYFDFNRNGDLTDDKVIEAEKDQNGPDHRGQSYRQIQFPRIDLTIDADGTQVEYSFFLEGYMNASQDYSYASVSLTAAAYREGDITLAGKKHHVVLLDFNSDGRFDSEIKIRDDDSCGRRADLSQQGDMLLVDLNTSNPGMDSPYDVTSGDSRHYVSKLVNIDGRYYDVKITPAGDNSR